MSEAHPLKISEKQAFTECSEVVSIIAKDEKELFSMWITI